jgi:hypothetical protein
MLLNASLSRSSSLVLVIHPWCLMGHITNRVPVAAGLTKPICRGRPTAVTLVAIMAAIGEASTARCAESRINLTNKYLA